MDERCVRWEKPKIVVFKTGGSDRVRKRQFNAHGPTRIAASIARVYATLLGYRNRICDYLVGTD